MLKWGMAKGRETKKRIIEKSAPIFNKLGFARASMADLMTATGLEKGGIYRHFASKEELACAAFDHACAVKEQEWFGPAEKEKPGFPQLEKFILSFSAIPSKIEGGCPIFNAAIEHDDGNLILKKRALAAYERWIARLISFIEKAKENGELAKIVQARKTAIFIFCTLEGALAVQRLTKSKNILIEQSRLILKELNTLRN
jgi:TetR/AcrR family transcriptional repressor of nem operon